MSVCVCSWMIGPLSLRHPPEGGYGAGIKKERRIKLEQFPFREIERKGPFFAIPSVVT